MPFTYYSSYSFPSTIINPAHFFGSMYFLRILSWAKMNAWDFIPFLAL